MAAKSGASSAQQGNEGESSSQESVKVPSLDKMYEFFLVHVDIKKVAKLKNKVRETIIKHERVAIFTKEFRKDLYGSTSVYISVTILGLIVQQTVLLQDALQGKEKMYNVPFLVNLSTAQTTLYEMIKNKLV